jgi:hypothetical protein
MQQQKPPKGRNTILPMALCEPIDMRIVSIDRPGFPLCADRRPIELVLSAAAPLVKKSPGGDEVK